MVCMKRPRQAAIEVLAEFRMRLAVVSGEKYTLDFKPLFDESPGLARLRYPEIFATARLIDGEGWSIEWSSLGIQIGSDTLWLDAQAQNASDESRRIFAQWYARHGLNLTQVSEGAILSDRYAKGKTVMGGRLLFG